THEIIYNVLITLYAILLPVYWYGYTIGKKVLNIRIEPVDGGKLTIWTMVKRNLLVGIVYVFTLGFGFIVSAFMVALRDDKRGIQGFIVGTIVTKVKKEKNKKTP